MTFWVYDCVHGQGSVEAPDENAARREAILDAGRNAQVRNVRQPDADEMAFRRAMNGTTPIGQNDQPGLAFSGELGDA